MMDSAAREQERAAWAKVHARFDPPQDDASRLRRLVGAEHLASLAVAKDYARPNDPPSDPDSRRARLLDHLEGR